MTDIKIVTACNKEVVNPDFTNTIIPKGSIGTLIDVSIENGEVLFLLDFDEETGYEWYSIDEVEEKC